MMLDPFGWPSKAPTIIPQARQYGNPRGAGSKSDRLGANKREDV
jgi:hypothetical protein